MPEQRQKISAQEFQKSLLSYNNRIHIKDLEVIENISASVGNNKRIIIENCNLHSILFIGDQKSLTLTNCKIGGLILGDYLKDLRIEGGEYDCIHLSEGVNIENFYLGSNCSESITQITTFILDGKIRGNILNTSFGELTIGKGGSNLKFMEKCEYFKISIILKS